MQRVVSRLRLSLLISCTLTASSSCSSVSADAPTGPPATVQQAAAVLDLSTFPLFNPTKEPQNRNVASLSYNAKSDVKQAFDFQRKQLLERGFKELPGGYSSDQTASGLFSKDGFRITVTVFPAGEPGEASVSILNLGNVQLEQLPVPADAKKSFGGPAVAMFLSEQPPTETAAACKKLLMEKGWQPYGAAGDVQFFKQNAVRLTANVVAAPAQGGKTMISYSSELMSANLPAPPDAHRVQYADSTKQLSFDTKSSLTEVAGWYRTELAKSGWEATTENLIKISFNDIMIFRNPAKDLMELEVHTVDGQTRGLLKFQTAAEVEAMEKRMREKLEKEKREKEKAKQE